MVNQGEFIKSAKKAFKIADFSHDLTQRVISKSAKRLIDYGFNYSKFRNKEGYNFKFDRTKRVKKHIADTKFYMEKSVSDLLDEVSKISYDTAKKNLGKVPDKDWDKEEYLAAILYGQTYRQRLNTYANTFKHEIETFIRVGQEEQMTADGIFHWYMEKKEEPKSDDLIIAAIAAGMVELEGLSAYRSFRNLNDDMVIRGFSRANAHHWMFAEGKFILAQEDELTCDTCLEINGKVYPIKEDVVPVHGSCRCIEIPIMNVPY